MEYFIQNTENVEVGGKSVQLMYLCIFFCVHIKKAAHAFP